MYVCAFFGAMIANHIADEWLPASRRVQDTVGIGIGIVVGILVGIVIILLDNDYDE
jgi:uncharacterized protein YqgC (DUF456 family)